MYLAKNDIKYLPFEKLSTDIATIRKQNEEEWLASKKAAVKLANETKLNHLVKDAAAYVDVEAGYEAIEESIRESASFYDLDEVELSSTEIAQCNELAVKECVPRFIAANSINTKHSWIMPQMKAYFGTWTPIRGEDGLYSARDTLIRNATDGFSRGIWQLARWSRSDLIKDPSVKMYQLGEYNHLVPIILSAFKVHKNIKYSEWSRSGLSNLVDKPLAEAMLASIPDFTTADLLEIRTDCLVVKTGTKAGQGRDPRTAHTLYGTESYSKHPIAQVPKLAQIMLTQIWCAHPANRTKHMVLDPRNWDSMPLPLVDTSATSNQYTSTSPVDDDVVIFR